MTDMTKVGWRRVIIKFDTYCKLCGRPLLTGESAWGTKSGPISRRTGVPRWIFMCDACHKISGATEVKESRFSGETFSEITKASGEKEFVLDDYFEGEEKKQQVVPRKYTVRWFQENAEWGLR